MARFTHSIQASGDASGRVLDLAIYDGIGFGGVSPAELRRALDEAGDVDVIRLALHSPGGDALDGVAMHTMLAAHPARVEVRVDGMALSAASVVAMAGDRIEMATGALMMIHDPWSMAMGGADDLRDQADTLDRVADSLADVYAGRMRAGDKLRARELMSAETWFTASEAVAAGFADEAIQISPVAAYGDFSRFRARPEALTKLSLLGIEVDAAFESRRPRAASQPTIPTEETPIVDRSPILAALGLAEDVADDAIVAAIKSATTLAASVREITSADPSEVSGVLLAWKAKVERFDALETEVAEAKAKALGTEHAALLDEGLGKTGKAAKLTPALAKVFGEQFAAALADGRGEAKLDELRAFLAAAPRVTPGKTPEPQPEASAYTGKAFAELTGDEKSQLKRDDPATYHALRNEWRAETFQ